MNTLSYKTISANKDTVNKSWYVIDASNEAVGRLSSNVAKILRGKNKPDFTPHVDCGDNVIIINAEKVRFTGNKLDAKQYVRHTGYPGGQRVTTPRQLFEKHPERILQNAIKGMLPKNRLSGQIMKNVYVYVGAEHPHAAQKPIELDINTIK